MINRILCAVLLGVAIGLSAGDAQPAPGGQTKVKGQIVAARVLGQVTLIEGPTAAPVVLKDGDRVSDASTIVTGPGASVILVFSNGATVDLAGDTRLKISEFIQDPFSADLRASDIKQETGTSVTRLYLTRGELVGRVAHLNVDQGSEFTVKTPVGAAGIRGTFFRHAFRPNGNHQASVSLETFEGLIAFTNLSGETFEVAAGHKFETTVPYSPRDEDNPEDWIPPGPVSVQVVFLSPTEAARFQSELQAILSALGGFTFHPQSGQSSPGLNNAGNGIDPNAPPPPAPPLNPPTPGAGKAGP
jgi:hypothetical protein